MIVKEYGSENKETIVLLHGGFYTVAQGANLILKNRKNTPRSLGTRGVFYRFFLSFRERLFLRIFLRGLRLQRLLRLLCLLLRLLFRFFSCVFVARARFPLGVDIARFQKRHFR